MKKVLAAIKQKTTHSFTGVFIVLLGLAAAASAVLIIPLVIGWKADPYSAIAELLLVFVLGLEGIAAVLHLKQARLDSVQQTLIDIYKEYHTAEMLLALETLHELYRAYPETFISEYMNRWDAERKEILKPPPVHPATNLADSWHFRRRRVTHFFALLAKLYDLDIITKEVIFKDWKEPNLRIIHDILIPLERVIAKELGKDPQVELLERLYNDGKKWGRP